jgi:hypothetical protein
MPDAKDLLGMSSPAWAKEGIVAASAMGNRDGSKARVAVAAASWDRRHAAGELSEGLTRREEAQLKEFGIRIAGGGSVSRKML